MIILIIDVGLHGCSELIWTWTFFSLMIKGPIWCFTYAYINRYEYFMFWICLNDQQWSTAHELPSHDDKCCKVMCFCFIGKSSVLFFSKALKFRMCTAIKYCSDFVNSVSIALQSYVTEHRILSSLPFIQRQSNEVQIVLLFFGTFVIFVAVHWWCFFLFSFLWSKK